eukprot:11203968-Lingulodinium_polyedra.AAC.1
MKSQRRTARAGMTTRTACANPKRRRLRTPGCGPLNPSRGPTLDAEDCAMGARIRLGAFLSEGA